METTTLETQQTGKLSVKSAGRTLKGSANAVSGEYICCVNYSGPGRVRGLFGIANGVSGERGLASEKAIETLKKCFRHIRESDSVNGSNLLPGCLEELHASLVNENTEKGSEDIAAAVICGYIEGETAHIALAGGGAAYLLEDGKISRITQDATTPDLKKTNPALLIPGQTPVGYTKTAFKPVFISQPIKQESTLIFCSDGLLARLNSLTIQEKIKNAGSLDEAADQIVNEARRHDDTGDIGVVLTRLETSDENKKTAATNSIGYTSTTYFFKYLACVILVAVLAILVVLGSNNIRGGKNNPGKNWAKPAPPVFDIGIKNIKSHRQNEAAMPTAKLRLETEPANALAFIDGVQQTGASPFEITVIADRATELRVEAAGFEPFEEKMRFEKDTSIQRVVSLHTIRAKNGSLLVICQPNCDRMEFDSHAMSGLPRDQVMIREIKPGDHRIKARLGDEVEGRTVRIVPGITQSIVFRFANERISSQDQPQPQAPTAVYNAKSGALQPDNSSKADVVRTRPESNKRELEQIKKTVEPPVTAGSSPAANDAFFIVDTNVVNCTVMVLKNNQLVMTGFSGTRYDVKPGKYTIEVSKSGFGEVQRDVVLDNTFQVIHFELKKQE